MKPAKFLWRISVATSLEAEDAVSEMLGEALSRAASSFFDMETGVSMVSVFRERKPAKNVRKMISASLRRAQNCGLKIGRGKISIGCVQRQDWSESWKRHFKPIEIGDALLIKPSWSKRRIKKNQAVVILDPGLSFGTGQHPTTAFCLREIARRRNLVVPQSFLDLGTGSGILAIAAAKLGYRPVRALDFDANAIHVARRNAKANGVLNKLQITHADIAKLPPRPAQKFDLISANLISDLLVTQRRRIAAQLNRGGTLILAGILGREFPQVQKAFESLGMKLIWHRSQKEWRSGSFRFAQKTFEQRVVSRV